MGTVSKTGKSREPRRDGPRRTLIVRRATEIFEQKGFAHTTFEDIAAAVGVKREAIYYYFRDKSEILFEIIKPESEYLLQSALRIRGLDIDEKEKLMLFIENHMMRFNPNYLEMAIAVRELSGKSSEPKLLSLRHIWKRYTNLWILLIREGQEQGRFPADLDPKLVAFAVLGMCNSASSWFDPNRGVTIAELSRTFVELVVNGIASGESTRATAQASGFHEDR